MSRKKKNLFEERVKQGKFTVVFNEILEAAYKSDLTQNELKVFLFIWRKTWGWGKDSEMIRVRDIVDELGWDHNRASIALSGLKKKHFVINSIPKRYQIQMDTSKYRIKRKIKSEKKDISSINSIPKKEQFGMKSIPSGIESIPTKSEDSRKNAHLQSPKDTFKRKKRKTTTRDVVSSLSEEKKSKPPQQELVDQGIAFINKAFVQNRWLPFHNKTKKEIIENLILIRKLDDIYKIQDWLRAWKKYIDTKNKQRKIGYLIEASKNDWPTPDVKVEVKPPCEEDPEDDMQDLQKEEGVEIA